MNAPLPVWNLSAIYPSLDSERYAADFRELAGLKEEIVKLLSSAPRQPFEEPAWLERFIALYNKYADLYITLYAFAYMHYSVNTGLAAAVKEMNRLQEIHVPVERSLVEFRQVLAGLKSSLADCFQAAPGLKDYSFFLGEQLFLRSRQMSSAEEELALELMRMGGDPWGRLQEAVSSNLKAVWDEKKGTTKTMTELRSLAFDPRRAARKRAFDLEVKLWESVKIPLSYSINGVKGFSTVLHKRRRYKNSLDYSLFAARLSPAALDSLTAVMTDSLPLFRRYLKAKAWMLKLPRLAFHDLFAPVQLKAKTWTFEEARALILKQFGAFSGELESFAKTAFSQGWIDAPSRAGKVGGAYCISLPRRRESRVLCNFTPSFAQATTIAHELGHAYHHHVLSDAPAIHRDYPMTLAETASIFSENLVYEGAIKSLPKAEKVEALEYFLQDATQVIVDILSRFLFESRLFEARPQGEASPEELCALMLQAQAETYGDALDPASLHPYMWAVKGHYYRPELPFYNYPYAFGLLFGLGLFAMYRGEGPRFAETYKAVLMKTGRMTCVELTKELGFDIEKRGFWENGIALIGSRIEEFERLAEAQTETEKRKPPIGTEGRRKGKTKAKKPAAGKKRKK